MESPAKKAKNEKQLFVDSGFTDDEITIGTSDAKKLFASKGFLAYSSPVFEKMFSSDFKEKITSTLKVDEKYDDFLLFLRCLQGRELHNITENTVLSVTKLAHMYECEALLNRCCIIMEECIEKVKYRSYVDFLVTADRFGLNKVKEKWINTLCLDKSHRSALYRNEEKFGEISPQTQIRILKERLRTLND